MAIPAAKTAPIVTPPEPATSPDLRPRYVQACESRAWTVYVAWKDGRREALCYRCRSWRHEGECRAWRARENRERIVERLDDVDPRHVMLLVLTFDQKRLAAAVAMVRLGAALRRAAGLWVEPEHEAGDARFLAFRSLWRRWQTLRQTLHRDARRRDERRARWGLTVEVHQSGWPHVNVMMEWPGLAERLATVDAEHECKRAGLACPRHRKRAGRQHRCIPCRRSRAAMADPCGHPGCIRDWLSGHATSSGFGRVLYLQPARDSRELAAYVLKLAGELEAGRPAGAPEQLDAVVAEVVKFSQVPTSAPPHFRRIRGSMRSDVEGVESFLAPPRRSPDVAGAAMIWQSPDQVAAAVEAGLDLVDVVDEQTGEVARMPWVLRPRPPPSPSWLDDKLAEARAEAQRLGALWAQWYACNAPELS